jgi:hypothetical protein
MSSDTEANAAADFIKTTFGDDADQCTNFKLSCVNASYSNGEFIATAQIDPVDGGPQTIQGASIYGEILPIRDISMFCGASVGPPMGNTAVMNLTLPFSLTTTSKSVKMTSPEKFIVAVAISYGSAENEMKTCVLSQIVAVTPNP